jgi:hypothetical protein
MIKLPEIIGRRKTYIAKFAVLVIIIFVYAQIGIQNSKECTLAKEYIQTNANILSEIGTVDRFGFWMNRHVQDDGKKSYIDISAHGSKKNVDIRVYLKRERVGQEWVIDHHETD